MMPFLFKNRIFHLPFLLKTEYFTLSAQLGPQVPRYTRI